MEQKGREELKRELARALAREFDRYRLVEEDGELMVEAKEKYIRKAKQELQTGL